MPLNTRIRNKRDTVANWEANNPVLLDGELIVVDTEDGTVKLKIGDGVKTYSELSFLDTGSSSGGTITTVRFDTMLI